MAVKINQGKKTASGVEWNKASEKEMITFMFQCASQCEVPFVSLHVHLRMHLCTHYVSTSLHVCGIKSVLFGNVMTLRVMQSLSCPLTECLAAAQGCCSHGRHMDCEQHIWGWDRQGLACSCTIHNMPSSTTCTPPFVISLLSWSSNCICNNTCEHSS